MSRALIRSAQVALLAAGALVSTACSAGDARTADRTTAALAIATAPVAAT